MNLYNKGFAQTLSPISCKDFVEVTGFKISGVQPENTDRRIVVKLGGTWQKFNGDQLIDISTQNLTIDSVLLEGNTVSELLSVQNIPSFIGKSVDVAIAMKAPMGSVDLPTISVGIKGKTAENVYKNIVETDEQKIVEFGEVLVNYFVCETECVGGSALIEVAFKSDDVWGPYTPIDEAGATMAQSVKYRITYIVDEIGTSTASVKSITAVYTGDE